MIYGKMWCVVKPSVGSPVIIGAVAVGSFLVHLSLTLNTTWVKKYLNGGAAEVSAMQPDTVQPVALLIAQDPARK